MKEFHFNVPGESPEIEVIEQTPEHILSRVEYSNGLIIISDVKTDGSVSISPNFNTILNPDGTFDFDMTSPNENFQDIIR